MYTVGTLGRFKGNIVIYKLDTPSKREVPGSGMHFRIEQTNQILKKVSDGIAHASSL